MSTGTAGTASVEAHVKAIAHGAHLRSGSDLMQLDERVLEQHYWPLARAQRAIVQDAFENRSSGVMLIPISLSIAAAGLSVAIIYREFQADAGDEIWRYIAAGAGLLLAVVAVALLGIAAFQALRSRKAGAIARHLRTCEGLLTRKEQRRARKGIQPSSVQPSQLAA